MGGSSKQTVGFKYFAGMQVAIGNCIEQILNINPDKRGWIFTKPEEIAQLKLGDTSMTVNKPDLFGGDKQEGGWVGTIDIHTGREEHLRQNEYLAAQDSELVSSFPGLSHLVYRGNNSDQGFQLVSMSGMLKEVLYWPKRTRIKDDGSEQWYKSYLDNDSNEIFVCEIGAKVNGLSPKEYQEKIDNLPPLLNEWWGTDNQDDLFHKFTNGGVPVTGLIEGYLWDFHAQFGHIGKVGYVKTSFPDFLIGLNIRLIILADDGISSFSWSGGDFELIREFSEPAFITCREYILSCTNSTLDLMVGIIDGVPGGSNTQHRVVIDCAIAPFNSNDKLMVKGIDINPIHQIREIITNDTAMNKPEAMINDSNFKNAADRIYDEDLGVSGAFTEKSCKEAIDELLFHIEAGIRLNRQTGQYEIVLFRDDLLNLSDAQVFSKSNIKSFNIEIANVDDVINSVNVNYYDRDNIKDSSFSLDEIGSVMSSEVNAQTLDFPYFMNRRNAELVGNWKLKQLSTPTRKGTFTTGKYEARKINKYDVVKLTWQNQNMVDVPVRIMKIGLGDGRDNTVTLDWVEVIPYSSTTFPTINVDPPTSVVLPPQQNQSVVFEMPYFEAVQRFGQTQVDAELANNPDLGYLVVATKKPQSNSINALLYTDDGTGYQQASIVDYCPVATLDQEISYLDASFAVKNVASISQAEVGTLILCDEELMMYQSYDTATKILSVKRAALDTVPKPHSQDAVFYFYDAFNAFDPEQYVLSEAINAKVLTTTPSGILGIEEAAVLSLEMNARPNRPYPPANVKINSDYYPEEIETDLVVTWVDRNRLQQTGGSILGWTDGGVALESGAATMLIIKELDENGIVIATHNVNATGTNTYTLAISAMQVETRSIEVKAKTLRDGYDSFQYFQHTVELSTFFSAPYNIEYTVREV
ncbi:phage tail protein [Acinetobacter sp. NIPH1876]|uniref:phage tail protein n=1 Tax=Acinetobacter sp. NIPH1876 TaxID=2924041 RepID=UPI001FAC4701|nr:phage tail protein [Acinetobacter sp. NIPH1876]MCJ0827343.1 phage tail protein [Acinetobacter sp. NIPH1876]